MKPKESFPLNRRHLAIGIFFCLVITLIVVLFKGPTGGTQTSLSSSHPQSKTSHREKEHQQKGNHKFSTEKISSFNEQFELLKSATDLKVKRATINRLLTDYSISHSREVLNAIITYSPAEHRENDILRLFQIMASRANIAEGARLLEELDAGSERTNIITGFWMSVENVPEDVFLKHFREMSLPEDKAAMLEALKRTQPKNEALLKKVIENESGAESSLIRNQFQLKGMVAAGFETMPSALKFINTQADEDIRDRLWDYYLTRLFKSAGGERTLIELEKVRGLIDDKRVDSSCARVIKLVVSDHPKNAAEILGSIKNQGARKSAVENISRRWLELNSLEAGNWISSLEEPNDR